MAGETEESADLWRQVASAVEYVAAVERPGFTVWDAVAEAVEDWLAEDGQVDAPEGTVSWTGEDRLRLLMIDAAGRVPPPGAPGGRPLAEVIASALSDWLHRMERALNLGLPFRLH